jgi:hypothetical protein
MNAIDLLNELRAAGIRIEPRPVGKLRLTPKDRLTPELIEKVRAAKAELLLLLAPQSTAEAKAATTHTDPAAKAMTLFARLRGCALPAGRIPAARAIAERLRPLLGDPSFDPAQAVVALQAAEAELTALGGTYDPELADAITLVTDAFPGGRLVGVRILQ